MLLVWIQYGVILLYSQRLQEMPQLRLWKCKYKSTISPTLTKTFYRLQVAILYSRHPTAHPNSPAQTWIPGRSEFPDSHQILTRLLCTYLITDEMDSLDFLVCRICRLLLNLKGTWGLEDSSPLKQGRTLKRLLSERNGRRVRRGD